MIRSLCSLYWSKYLWHLSLLVYLAAESPAKKNGEDVMHASTGNKREEFEVDCLCLYAFLRADFVALWCGHDSSWVSSGLELLTLHRSWIPIFLTKTRVWFDVAFLEWEINFWDIVMFSVYREEDAWPFFFHTRAAWFYFVLRSFRNLVILYFFLYSASSIPL